LNVLIHLATAVALISFSFMIQPWIERKWNDIRLSINLMRIGVGSALVLSATIEAISSGNLPVSGYFVTLGTLVSVLIYYGITHRNEVPQKMRRSYYNGLIGFTYTLSATGLLMFWYSPFFPNVVL